MSIAIGAPVSHFAPPSFQSSQTSSTGDGSETEKLRGKGAAPGQLAKAAIASLENAPANLHGQVTSAIARGIDYSSLLSVQEAAAEPAEGGDEVIVEEPVVAETDAVVAETVANEVEAAPVETADDGVEALAADDDGAEATATTTETTTTDETADTVPVEEEVELSTAQLARAEIGEAGGIPDDAAANFFGKLVSYIDQGGTGAEFFAALSGEPEPVEGGDGGEPDAGDTEPVDETGVI